MTRGQRRLHALLWPVLAVLLAAVFIGALAERARVAEAASAAVAEDG
jgi:hypothetical protein